MIFFFVLSVPFEAKSNLLLIDQPSASHPQGFQYLTSGAVHAPDVRASLWQIDSYDRSGVIALTRRPFAST